ncbi:beta-phosphoglucomutase, partial [bacterium]|nr:beta-phosphoglucomutase [bacterium]
MPEKGNEDISKIFTWKLSYNRFQPVQEGLREALCTLGNGYLGVRGAIYESSASRVHYPGTYIAGVYNELPTLIAGKKILNEDFVNCPNWLPITFKLSDGEWFDMNETEVINFIRRLDFRDGVLYKKAIVRDQVGRETLIESSRLASMAQSHLVALKYSITPLNYSERISIRSGLNGAIINAGVARYHQLNSKHMEPILEGGQDDISYLMLQTSQSKIRIAEAAKVLVFIDGQRIDPRISIRKLDGAVYSTFTVEAQKGRP